MYFKSAESSLLESLRSLPFRTPANRYEDGYININISKNDGMAKVCIDVYQNEKLTAWFIKKNIIFADISGKHGCAKELLNGHFIENSFDMLMHNNIWSFLLSPIVSEILQTKFDDLDEFLSKAIKS